MQSYFLLPIATLPAHTNTEMYMAVGVIIPIKNNSPPIIEQINEADINDELNSLPFDKKFIIKIPKIIIRIAVPRSPPVPHPSPTQKIYLSILTMKSKIPVVFETAVILYVILYQLLILKNKYINPNVTMTVKAVVKYNLMSIAGAVFS